MTIAKLSNNSAQKIACLILVFPEAAIVIRVVVVQPFIAEFHNPFRDEDAITGVGLQGAR
jgi:hypothetical protein